MNKANINDFMKTLKLTNHEWRIFEFLKIKLATGNSAGLTVAEITARLQLPRMSTHITLKSLRDRGLVDYDRVGKRKFWHSLDSEKITTRFAHISSSLHSTSETTIGIKDSEFTVYHGTDALYKSWEVLLELSPYERVQGIQSAASLIENLKRLDWQKKIKRLQENIRNKPIILEGLLTEDYYPSMIEFYKKDKKLLLNALESFLGRSTDMTFIRKQFLNIPTEMLILPNAAFISNWKEEVSIKITNKTMINFLKELFELAKGYGKHVDQNKYIAELIEKVK